MGPVFPAFLVLPGETKGCCGGDMGHDLQDAGPGPQQGPT